MRYRIEAHVEADDLGVLGSLLASIGREAAEGHKHAVHTTEQGKWQYSVNESPEVQHTMHGLPTFPPAAEAALELDAEE